VRFIHTSDWHVGRTVRGRSREAEHEAVLQEVLTHAREQAVDCLLIAGDVFDSSSPSAESERLVYEFFRELHGLGIAAVVIAGNHDHPRRFDALAPLLQSLGIHLVGEPRPADQGGVVEVDSRDGKEKALVAALPWVTERRAVEFEMLVEGTGAALGQYADRVIEYMRRLTTPFRADTVNVLLGHALVNDSVVGRGGGERPLHLSMGIYGIQRQRFPKEAQYVALGHVHKAQEILKSPSAWYSGSLLQLDFGETQQDKYVTLAEIHARQPASVEKLSLKQGRQLFDIGSPTRGVSLEEIPAYAEKMGDAWLRVFVDLDLPVANLPSLVREHLPNAVDVQRAKPQGAESAAREPAGRRSAEEMFAAFYRSSNGRGKEPAPATMTLFRKLLDEVSHETADA
jgi:DNA repair protein SbcD/Mre11